MLKRILINDIDITDYKRHPRILELRFVATYDRWYKEFGERADGILLGLATAFHCDISKLRAVANQSSEIRKVLKGDRIRNIQEHVFMGEVWHETRYMVSSRYLSITKRTLYGRHEYTPKVYVTEEWLNALDNEVVACGLKQYAIEVERFLDSLEVLRGVI